MRMRGVIMKERIDRFKEWISKNKKRAVGIAVAVVLLVGALGIGIAGVYGDQSQASDKVVASEVNKNEKEKVTATDESKDKEKTETEQKAEEEQKAKEEEGKKAVEQKAEETKSQSTQQASGNTKSSANASASQSKSSSGSTQSSSSSQSTHTHNYNIPIYSSKQVYVVDKAAWTETVEEPIYSTKEVAICNTCKADISGYAENHILEGNCEGYHSEVKQVQTGTTTRTINHPEEGHYETESYISGYKCSCGASK